MKIEVLYVPDCPHHPAATSKVKEILAAEGVAAEIDEVVVTDLAAANAFRFCGSPTIRINGRDVVEEAEGVREFAVSCRLYPGSGQLGVPPAEMIRRAVRGARVRENP